MCSILPACCGTLRNWRRDQRGRPGVPWSHTNSANNDRHPEAPARLRGPRRMAASPYVPPTLRGSLRSHLRLTDELLLAPLVSVLRGVAAQEFLESFELQLDHVPGRLVDQFEYLLVKFLVRKTDE